MRPVGREPASVYWVRRGLVIVVILALLLGVRWLLTGRSSSSTTASPASSTSPVASPTPIPSASRTAAASPSASRTPSSASASPSTSASTVAATPTCKDSQITVTAATDAATYPVGSTPRLRMRIQNTSQTACRRDIGADQNELVINSGATHVWSSDDCNPGGKPQIETIAPGQSFSVAVTWLGRLSQKGCPANQPAAAAGSYKLVGRNGTASSQPAVFSLT
jgi:cytoskeletal protein RodZ